MTVEIFNPYANLQAWKGIVKHPRISDGAKVTYSVLTWHAGKNGRCYPSVAHIAEERGGISDRAVKRHLRELVTHGLIQIEHQFDEHGRQKTSFYRFINHGGRVTEVSPSGVTEVSRGRVTQTSPKSNHHQSKHKESKKLKSKTARSSAREQRKTSVKDAGQHRKQPASSAQTPKAPSISKFDDDERPAYPSARDEVIDICKRRGKELKYPTLVKLDHLLEQQRGSWQQLLEAFREDLERVNNPGGFLTSRARQFKASCTSIEPRLLNDTPAPKPEPEKCPKCQSKRGEGILQLSPTMTFCECATPEFIADRTAKEREKEQRRQAAGAVPARQAS